MLKIDSVLARRKPFNETPKPIQTQMKPYPLPHKKKLKPITSCQNRIRSIYSISPPGSVNFQFA